MLETKSLFERFTIICERLILSFCVFYNAYLCTYFASSVFGKIGLFILCFIVECVISSQIYTKLSNGEYTKVSDELQHDILLGKDYHESYAKLKTICDRYRHVELIVFGIICCLLNWFIKYEW
jgi:uncharacterized membrane protein (DUF485 family)